MLISLFWTREMLVEMPCDIEICHIMNAVENWKAEMLTRVEGYIKNVVTRNA